MEVLTARFALVGQTPTHQLDIESQVLPSKYVIHIEHDLFRGDLIDSGHHAVAELDFDTRCQAGGRCGRWEGHDHTWVLQATNTYREDR